VTLHSKQKKYREQVKEKDIRRTEICSCKKRYPFCDGVVFFVDRSLLMGASIVTIRDNIEIEYTFWLYGSVRVIFGQFKLFFVSVDKHKRDIPMIEAV
jgi:hypothetical protein